MVNFKCGYCDGEGFEKSFKECENCGNHICVKRAKELHGVCPHCFGRLFDIS